MLTMKTHETQAKAARLACGTTSTRPAMEQLAFVFALGLTLARGN